MSEQDTLQRFIFENADIRGEIVHLTQSYQRIMHQHDYPKTIKHLLGEVLVCSVLMTSTLKFKGQLTAQFTSNGPLKMLVAKCDHQNHIRAYAKFDDASPQEWLQSLDDGHLVITIQTEKGKSYQSIVPISHRSIAQSLESYFVQSEQISTRLWVASNDDIASGMLLQLMPEQASTVRENFWEYAVKIGETITEKELLELDNMTLIHRLYHEEDIRVFDATHVQFMCTCTIDKMSNAVKMMGHDEAKALLKDRRFIEVRCEYCNHHYEFDSIDIEVLFRE